MSYIESSIIANASCLIRVRERNIGYSSRFSHFPEDMPPETVNDILKYVEDAMAVPEEIKDLRRIVLSTDKFLILGIDGYLQKFVPDPDGIFDGFRDVSGNRRSHGFVGLVWNKALQGRSGLPNTFPTDESFAEVIRTELLTPLPWPRSKERWAAMRPEDQERARANWDSLSPEERFKNSTPWFLSDHDEWADAIHSGAGYPVPYRFSPSFRADVSAPAGREKMNASRPECVMCFSLSMGSALLDSAVKIAAMNNFSFCTDLYYRENDSTVFMNITSACMEFPASGTLLPNRLQIKANSRISDRSTHAARQTSYPSGSAQTTQRNHSRGNSSSYDSAGFQNGRREYLGASARTPEDPKSGIRFHIRFTVSYKGQGILKTKDLKELERRMIRGAKDALLHMNREDKDGISREIEFYRPKLAAVADRLFRENIWTYEMDASLASQNEISAILNGARNHAINAFRLRSDDLVIKVIDEGPWTEEETAYGEHDTPLVEDEFSASVLQSLPAKLDLSSMVRIKESSGTGQASQKDTQKKKKRENLFD